MKKASLIINIILLILLISLFIYLKSMDKIVEEKNQEIEASSRYIESLKTKLLDNNLEEDHEKDRKDLKLLLEDFISKENSVNENKDIENYQNIIALEKRERFIPNVVPVTGEYEISQRFSEEHKGLDFATEIGREVFAAAAGEVVKVDYDKYFGNMVIIDHFNGYMTVYSHLAKSLTTVEAFVKKGDVIGLVGSTGNSSGPHLHFEIIHHTARINPEVMLNTKNGENNDQE